MNCKLLEKLGLKKEDLEPKNPWDVEEHEKEETDLRLSDIEDALIELAEILEGE